MHIGLWGLDLPMADDTNENIAKCSHQHLIPVKYVLEPMKWMSSRG